MSELEPCPFCGGESAIEVIPGATGPRRSPGCRDETCIGFQVMTSYDREIDAINAWNRRAADPAHADEEAALSDEEQLVAKIVFEWMTDSRYRIPSTLNDWQLKGAAQLAARASRRAAFGEK